MTRKLSDRQRAVVPTMADAEPKMRVGEYEANNPREARVLSPYQTGDIVLTRVGNDVRRALVVGVVASALSHGGWLPCYRCRIETKRGEWASLWSNVWPGDIERAFDARDAANTAGG